MSHVFFSPKVGEKFCSEEVKNGELWPKTPDGDTVINRTCPQGRVGYKSRTCEDVTWQEVFSKCTNKELGKVANAANVSGVFTFFLNWEMQMNDIRDAKKVWGTYKVKNIFLDE